jgi:hypothetical protein
MSIALLIFLQYLTYDNFYQYFTYYVEIHANEDIFYKLS